MASRRPTKKKGRRGRQSAFSDALRLPRMPHFDDQELDLIGLGLVALAAFFAFVFYLGWDGGKVGETLGDGFIYAFGGVGYLAPIALFGAGAVLVLRQLLPSVRPFKAGSACLLAGLMLGLAAGSFGLGPDHPARHGYFNPEYFKHHGGAVGDAMYAITKTLIQQFGTGHPVPVPDGRGHPAAHRRFAGRNRARHRRERDGNDSARAPVHARVRRDRVRKAGRGAAGAGTGARG